MKKYIILSALVLTAPVFVQAQSTTVACPSGFNCTPVAQQVSGCPAGYVCTPISTQTFDNGYYYSGGYYSTPNTSVAPSTLNTTNTTPNIPVTSTSIPAVSGANGPCTIFVSDLTLGSYGAEVAALQVWLISRGFDIPAISSGAQATGFFSYQTASALARYQASRGLPNTGYFGPQTRALVNAACGTTPSNPANPNPGPSNPPTTTNSLSASCSGVVSAASASQINWTASATGGRAPYQYAWSAYGDVSGYPSPTTNTASFSAAYFSAGTKQAVVKVTDSNNTSVNASCTGNAVAGSNTPTVPPSTPNQPTQPLSSSCSGTVSGDRRITWTGQSTGGTLPRQYSWSIYNDVSGYGSGSTASERADVNYSTAGTKQAYFIVKDASGATSYASCSSMIPISSPTTQPITANLNTTSSCVVPGTVMTFTANVTGDGITAKTLEKDTNGDGVFGQVASWGAGSGTNTYTSNESATYSGTYTLRLLVNGVIRDTKRVTVASSCGPTTVIPPVITPTPTTATLRAASRCIVPGTNTVYTATVTGSGVTSVVMEKDTNQDGIYGQVGSWNGPGTYTFTTTEPASYTGRIDMKLKVNGQEWAWDNTTVSASCTPTAAPQPTAIAASCTGTTQFMGTTGIKVINWFGSATGGTAPYQYSWNIYGDVSYYGTGSTISQSVSPAYGSAGTKQAVLTVTDSKGASAQGTCTGTVY